ncbi:MAG: pyruvate dehydrogenase complex dihydrolipoamide acetyltransferase [Candidatus Puniceispirillales bacterium WSBS_2018_MAG_OTU23]
MAIITMPALSPTMTEGKLAKWLVKKGDEVRSGDVIAEIETDKAVMEVEALDDGVVASIVVAEGTQAITVGAVIAEILEEGGVSELGKTPPTVESKNPAAEAPPLPIPTPEKQMPETTTSTAPNIGKNTNRVFASPLARRVAADKGVDLNSITGSGPRGRIILADIDQAPKSGIKTPSAMMEGAESTEYENTQMRMIIAERLQQSKRDAPHFYLNMDINIDAMLAARQSLNNHAPEGVKISVNDMIIKAAAVALMRVPAANASWEGAITRRWHHADIAVAVSIEGGLVTPIIRRAEEKGLNAISTEMADLAARARTGKLQPEEYNGGSFTISNLGMFGITSFSAVINPPQGAILAIGAGEARAVVRDGVLVAATMMTATMSCDHRVVDGAVGAEWLKAFKDVIENPVLALA